MRNNHLVGLLLALAWLVALIFNFYWAWFSTPDVVLLTSVCIFFSGHRPFWRYFLIFAFLNDLASDSNILGFHAFYYALILSLLNLTHRFWLDASSASRLLMVMFASALMQISRIFLLFLITGMTAPMNWFWAIPCQILLWGFIHAGVMFVLGAPNER